MRKIGLAVIVLATCIVAIYVLWPRGPVEITRDLKIPTRDGVHLLADLYRPTEGSGPWPTILIRTPYNKDWYTPATDPATRFARHGYAVVIQNMRGRWGSEGVYTISEKDREDGYDLIEWVIDQPWSTDRVGSFGCSALGESQLQLAATRHPAHAAVIAESAGCNLRHFGAWTHGAFELATSLGWFLDYGAKRTPAPKPEVDRTELWWTLPIVDMLERAGAPQTDWERVASSPPPSPFWESLGLASADDRFDVPALHVNGWYDLCVRETLDAFNLFRDRALTPRGRNQHVIITPTAHCEFAGFDGSAFEGGSACPGEVDFYDTYLRFFDRWLRDGPDPEIPRVQLFVMGANRWRHAESWPLPGTVVTPLYLTSGGRANSRHGDGRLRFALPREASFDAYLYDPADPVPSLGGAACCTGTPDAPAGRFDQREIEEREDVLVYSTAPLSEPLEVVGPIEAVLYVSSDAPDTDFTAKLIDVYPDGRAINIQEGIVRARTRAPDAGALDTAGIVELRVDLQATANRFLAGHRIRLEVSSSNFPRWDRNLNTGGNNYDETSFRSATNRIHHSPSHPSRLLLPVVPLEDSQCSEGERD